MVRFIFLMGRSKQCLTAKSKGPNGYTMSVFRVPCRNAISLFLFVGSGI